MNKHYTVLCEVKSQRIEFEGRQYNRGDYALIPRHMAVQYKDAVRILSRDEQLTLEAKWQAEG